MSEIVKSEYNALDEQGNYKKHYFKTSADQVVGLGRMKNTEYQVGDVVYSDTNNKVALRCISNGTTSNEELDVSNALFGMDIYDGTCVWNIVGRISDSVPIGTIFAFGANEHPIGYLACDGTAVSRIVYADLFAVIGTTYGAGDGSTTFNLPNLNNGSFLEGSDVVGTAKSAGLPNVYGKFGAFAVLVNNDMYDGAFAPRTDGLPGANIETMTDYPGTNAQPSYFDASRCSSVYRDDITTVQPKAVTVKFCIKAYGAITNAGSVELEEMAKDYERIASSYLPLSGGYVTGDLVIQKGKHVFYETDSDEKIPLVTLEKRTARGRQFYGGLLVQWGSVVLNTNFKTVNFEIPYTNGAFSCAVMLDGSTTDSIVPMAITADDGASVQLKLNTGEFGCKWVAVGVGRNIDGSR